MKQQIKESNQNQPASAGQNVQAQLRAAQSENPAQDAGGALAAAPCSAVSERPIAGIIRDKVVGIMLIVAMIGYIVLSVDYLLPSSYKIFPLSESSQRIEEFFEKKSASPPKSSEKTPNLNPDSLSQK